MKFSYLLSLLFSVVSCYIPNVMPFMLKESQFLNNLILDNNLPCHLTSSRIKTFESDLYNLHDLIGFRFVFYNKMICLNTIIFKIRKISYVYMQLFK